MTQIDVNGNVYDNRNVTVAGKAITRWNDLNAFTQGYIEALFASAVDPRGRMMMPRDGRYASAPRERRKVGFYSLAPETLAGIIADCDRFYFGTVTPPALLTAEHGALFWANRQTGMFGGFPPQTVQLGDDGKVRFA